MLTRSRPTGHGHTAKYLDRTKVTKYVALEPNANMHSRIRTAAAAASFTEAAGTLLILPYGAEHAARIASALGGPHTAQTIVAFMSLCSVPDQERTVRALAEGVLAARGALLFYEHVLNPRADVAWWQRAWTPVWRRAFGGCCLDRRTDVLLEGLGVWESAEVWTPEGEREEELFWHRAGKLVKAA